MNVNEQVSNKIVFIFLTVTNIFYLLIVSMLHFELEIPIDEFGGIAFAIGFTTSLILMSYISYKAIREDADRTKTIIKLAITHVPCIIGTTLYLVYGFVVV